MQLHLVKTLVQGDVQCENSAFFTALSPSAGAEVCLRPQLAKKNWELFFYGWFGLTSRLTNNNGFPLGC